MKGRRIGIYAGAFDPVHAGHIGFALQAMERAKLDRLYFLPERRPRHIQGVEHFGHRVAMLRRASKPHPKFGVLELPDISFDVRRTLPRLQHNFEGDQLVFLFGSDVAVRLPEWPQAEYLLTTCELIVGVRDFDDEAQLKAQIARWPVQPLSLEIFSSVSPNITSREVRAALQRREYAQGLLQSVQRYSNRHWLYVSLA
jgi:nicotinate-nucleotide adenylyltransferase